MPGNLKSTEKDVAAAGTAEALVSSATYVTSVTIKAKAANTGNMYVGDSTVDNAGTFPPLSPSDVLTVSSPYEFNLADIFVDADVDGEGVELWYMLV